MNSPPVNHSPASKPKLENILWIWFFTMIAVRVLHELQRIDFFAKYNAVLTALVLLYVPVLYLMVYKQRIRFFERSIFELLRSTALFVVLSVVIFTVVELLNRYCFQPYFLHRHYVGASFEKLKPLWNFAFFQLVLVALPEEFFYRGFIQTQFQFFDKKPQRLGPLTWQWSLIGTAALFAFSHSLIQFQWWHFAIFFPGLVFGWLREKTGAITASILFHALANTYSYWVALNYSK